jgi:hypothetical protein
MTTCKETASVIRLFRRWRIDKTPTDCTFAQLEVVPPQELALIFSHDR